jgi:ribosomal protein S18 acetylase RimI-like enzyme
MAYTAHVLRTDDDAVRKYFAGRYTALRIQGLKQSPDAFSATLEGESVLTEEEQLARICMPKKDIFVVVASSDDDEQHNGDWWEREWVAQATVWGPHTWEEHVAPFQHTHAKSDRHLSDKELALTTQIADKSSALFFHMTALYVDVGHRRKGLANLLCEHIFSHLAAMTKPIAQLAELRIIIKPTNVVVMKMYEQLGFVPVADVMSTLAEATYAAGDQSSLPDRFEEDLLYTTRRGLFMYKSIPMS